MHVLFNGSGEVVTPMSLLLYIVCVYCNGL